MDSSPQAGSVPTIATLVQRRLDEGHSTRALSRMAAGAGYAISHQTLSNLARGKPATWPDVPTMQALAFLTGRTERAILLSFGAQFGLRVETVDVADLVPAGVAQLPQPVQDAILQLLRSLADMTEESGAVPKVPQRTLSSPNTIVGTNRNTQSEQSDEA